MVCDATTAVAVCDISVQTATSDNLNAVVLFLSTHSTFRICCQWYRDRKDFVLDDLVSRAVREAMNMATMAEKSKINLAKTPQYLMDS